MQVCPAPPKQSRTAAAAARGTSASAATYSAFLPPSSSVQPVSRAPARAATCRPTASEPVNRTWSATSTTASPSAAPSPASTENRPSGRPASRSRPATAPGQRHRAQGRLGEDRVAGQQRRQRVAEHEDERVVPGGDVDHEPGGHPADDGVAEHGHEAGPPLGRQQRRGRAGRGSAATCSTPTTSRNASPRDLPVTSWTRSVSSSRRRSTASCTACSTRARSRTGQRRPGGLRAAGRGRRGGDVGRGAAGHVAHGLPGGRGDQGQVVARSR